MSFQDSNFSPDTTKRIEAINNGFDSMNSNKKDDIESSEIVYNLYKFIPFLSKACHYPRILHFKNFKDIQIIYLVHLGNNLCNQKIKQINCRNIPQYTCQEHNNAKFNCYCFICKKNSCSKCTCENENHKLLPFDSIENEINYINRKINDNLKFGQEPMEINKEEHVDYDLHNEKPENVMDANLHDFYELASIIINEYKIYPTIELFLNINNIYYFLKNKNELHIYNIEFNMMYLFENNDQFSQLYNNNKNEIKKVLINGNEINLNDKNNYTHEINNNLFNNKIFEIQFGYNNIENINKMLFNDSKLISFSIISSRIDYNQLNTQINLFYKDSLSLISKNSNENNESHLFMFYGRTFFEFLPNVSNNSSLYENNKLISNRINNTDRNDSIVIDLDNNSINNEGNIDDPLLGNINDMNERTNDFRNNLNLCNKYKKRIIFFILLIIILILILAIVLFYIFNEKERQKNSEKKNKSDNKRNKDDIIIDFDDLNILKNGVLESEKETKVGAHYKCYSQVIIGSAKVKTMAKLPDSINTNFESRNGYMSLGVRGYNDSINVGILTSGIGWTPFYYYHQTEYMFCFKEYKTNEDIEFIEMEVEVTEKGVLSAYFGFRNSTLFLLYSLHFELDISHILEFENDKATYKFFRFASLVPKGEDDQNDGTFIENGKFIGLTITINNKTESWGISDNYIEDSWVISSKRIKVEYANNEEKFSIIHRNTTSF